MDNAFKVNNSEQTRCNGGAGNENEGDYTQERRGVLRGCRRYAGGQ
jgi:hypothetical protein